MMLCPMTLKTSFTVLRCCCEIEDALYLLQLLSVR